MKPRIFTKLFFAFLIITAVCTLLLDYGVRNAWRLNLTHEIERGVESNVRQFALAVEKLGQAKPLHSSPELDELAKQHATAMGGRATVIDLHGVVLADSEADPAKMENHAHR